MRTMVLLACMIVQLLAAPVWSAPAGPGSAPDSGAAPLPVVAASEVQGVRDVPTRRYTGRVVSPATVNLVPRVSGEIIEVGFRDGTNVGAGQTLFRIDPVRYAAAVKSAEGKVMQCRAEYSYAKADLDRNRILFRQTSVSRDVLESAERTEKVRQGELLAAEADLVLAQDDLRNTTIKAPAAGQIGVTSFTAGNYVTTTSGTLVTLLQTDPIRVRFALSTRDLLATYGTVRELQTSGRVQVRLADDTEYAVTGRVVIADNAAGDKTDTILMYAEFPNPDGRLVPGSTVVVTLSREGGKAAVAAVPPAAVLHDAGGAYVYVLSADAQVKKRRVTLGDMAGNLQKILSGVDIGERIITDGTHKIADGVRVDCRMENTSQVKS